MVFSYIDQDQVLGEDVLGLALRGGLSMVRLYPSEYMAEGSKGPGVRLLQLMLKARGSDRGQPIGVTGEYCAETREAVRKLQSALGFGGSECDGRFGPATRKRFAQQFGIDVSLLTSEQFVGPTLCRDPSVKEGVL